MNNAFRLYPWMNVYQNKGWAISKRVSFHYFYTHFSILISGFFATSFYESFKDSEA